MNVNSRKNSAFIVAGVGLIMVFILIYQMVLAGDDYLVREQNRRDEKDEFFRTQPDSPVPDSLKAIFPGLTYFDLDHKYRVTAQLERFKNPPIVKIPTNTDEPEEYLVAGNLRFNLKGQEFILLAYQKNKNDGRALFVPFRDATSGKESYGGGRYMDVHTRENDRVDLDFNKAYNPYCVYNYSYVCPVPPPENTLSIAIEAGERDFHWPKEAGLE